MPEVLILGAGVIGTSIAFHLASRGVTDVAVLDRGSVGEGGSGRSSALIRMHYTFAPEVRLAVTSLEYFRNWRHIVGRPGTFRQTGFVRLVGPGESERLWRNVAMQRELGVEVEVVAPDGLRALVPGWNVDDVELAAYEPGSGYGDGAATAGDFLARAREIGVDYRPSTRVRSIRIHDGRVAGVETDRGAVDAPVVVVAAGPWSPPLLSSAGVGLPIEPEFHVVAVLRMGEGSGDPGLACIDSVTATYLRPEGQGLALVGDFSGERGSDPDAFPDRAPEEALVELVGRASRRVPALAEAGLAGGVTGVYDMTPDARPLLGRVGPDGLLVAAGFSGMGFKISPAVGLGMAELILDGEARSVDLASFDPMRFERGRPIEAEFEYAQD
ncbi:MAG TPA: FAD-binding oxidoreductase [Actinomycetota bacterium]